MKNLKINLVFALMALSPLAFSQVIIGGSVGSAGSNTASVLLDFPTGQNKGIILPYVTSLPAAPAGGTILLDATNPTGARVKYYNDSSWVDLSEIDGNVLTALNNQPLTPETGKAIIGALSSDADGVLVLESTTKAMVLPIVADVNDVPSPSPGMMVYVNKANAKRLAVFNGSYWSFWQP